MSCGIPSGLVAVFQAATADLSGSERSPPPRAQPPRNIFAPDKLLGCVTRSPRSDTRLVDSVLARSEPAVPCRRRERLRVTQLAA